MSNFLKSNKGLLCTPHLAGLSKIASCRLKLLPTRLVWAGYSVRHFFTDGVFKIEYPWTG